MLAVDVGQQYVSPIYDSYDVSLIRQITPLLRLFIMTHLKLKLFRLFRVL